MTHNVAARATTPDYDSLGIDSQRCCILSALVFLASVKSRVLYKLTHCSASNESFTAYGNGYSGALSQSASPVISNATIIQPIVNADNNRIRLLSNQPVHRLFRVMVSKDPSFAGQQNTRLSQERIVPPPCVTKNSTASFLTSLSL